MIKNINIAGTEGCDITSVIWEATGGASFQEQPETGSLIATVVVDDSIEGLVTATVVSGNCIKELEYPFGTNESECDVTGVWRIANGQLRFVIIGANRIGDGTAIPMFDNANYDQDGNTHTFTWDNYDPNTVYGFKLKTSCGQVNIFLAQNPEGEGGQLNIEIND